MFYKLGLFIKADLKRKDIPKTNENENTLHGDLLLHTV